MSRHFLERLLNPESIAIVGASNRKDSPGYRLCSNLIEGGYQGTLWFINGRHKQMFGQKGLRSLRKLPEPVDLAILLTPEPTLERMIDHCAAQGITIALVMTVTDRYTTIAQYAKERGVRLLGPGSAGLVRPALSLYATYSNNHIRPGRLGVISHSAALAGAVLDWADNNAIGFSTLITTGLESDVSMAELVDALAADHTTRAIILYLDHVQDSRTFISAVSAASRVKPVLLMRSTQGSARYCDLEARTGQVFSSDRVFQAAITRAGAVRIRTFSNLFSAARTLAGGARLKGKRIAIVSNGAAPAMLASDRILAKGFVLPALDPTLKGVIHTQAEQRWSGVNPVVLRHYQTLPVSFAAITRLLLEDDRYDAVMALYVPDPRSDTLAVAEALSDVSESANKPLIACWMGETHVVKSRKLFRERGVLNFRTPEAATDAIDFMHRHYRSMQLLLQVPQPIEDQTHTKRIQGLRHTIHTALIDHRRTLSPSEAMQLLPPVHINTDASPARTDTRALRLRVYNDIVFGPVISLGLAGDMASMVHDFPVQLPPLNRFLIDDMLEHPALQGYLGLNQVDNTNRPSVVSKDALIQVMLDLSHLVCELPELYEVDIHPLTLSANSAVPTQVTATLQQYRTRFIRREYPRLAIHPYPTAWERQITLKKSGTAHLRPIRAEDARSLAALVTSLSPESRYMRFMHAIEELPPLMLAQFTKIDYERQMAFCAVSPDDPSKIIGVCRYTHSAIEDEVEFAITISDEWQGEGLASALMTLLQEHAASHGIHAIYGDVLRNNKAMKGLMSSLGYKPKLKLDEPEQVRYTLVLGDPSAQQQTANEQVLN